MNWLLTIVTFLPLVGVAIILLLNSETLIKQIAVATGVANITWAWMV
jgi:hypothetical protein